jgi:hypothetical protein
LVLALAIWVIGQDVGLLYTGQATDPNTALVVALMAVAILGGLPALVGVRARKAGVGARAFGEGSAARPSPSMSVAASTLRSAVTRKSTK